MARTALTGPLVIFGQAPSNDVNTQAGPSMFYEGTALMDQRVGYDPGSINPVVGFATGSYTLVDQVPSTLAANNIAAAQVPTAGVALTRVTSSAAGITVGISVVTNAGTGPIVTGQLAIDGAFGTVSFGTSGFIRLYDPTKAISRNVRITSVGNDSAATFTVRGYDLYGYAMTETITGANAGIASGKKAWKYITSITPAGTLSGSNVSVGTGDVYGLPLRVDTFAYATIYWNSAAITANTGFTAAVTSTASATTGDVRGTYAVQSASDGTKSIQIFVRPSVANLGSTTGLFGVAQF